jgi:hypothetical protein
MTSAEVAPPTIIALLPLFLMSAVLAAFIFFLAKRKGQSAFLLLIGLVPFVNILVAIWLASLTDKSVLEQIEALKRQKEA